MTCRADVADINHCAATVTITGCADEIMREGVLNKGN